MAEDVQRFVSFAFTSADLLVEVSAQGTVGFVMGAASVLSGRKESELVHQNWLEIFDPPDRPVLDKLVKRLGVGARCGPILVGMAAHTEKGTPRRALFNACRLPGQEDRTFCTLTQASLPLLQQAGATRRNADTNLLARDDFTRVAAEMAQAGKDYAQNVGVAFVDIPELAGLADKAPALSKELLNKVSALLRSTSIDGTSVGQLSESRFGVVHNSNEAALKEQLAHLVEEGAACGVELSVQSQNFDATSGTLNRTDLVKAIRFAVNKFAALGPNNAIPGNPAQALERLVGETVRKMSNFSSVVRDDRFHIFFQPIIDIRSGQLHHYETLARFEDGKSPFEMIQFAEEIGIIEDFDLAVCSRALSTLKSHKYSPSILPAIAVNISGKSIENSIFAKIILKMLDDNWDQAAFLLFEITESSAIENLAQVNTTLQEIRRRGFHVCLDDLGSGAASFQYLQALNVDFVKIDGAYVKRLGVSERDDALIKGIVRLCDDLKVGTIGEMVETIEQASMLSDMGVRYGQGWLYGKAEAEPSWVARPELALQPSGRLIGAEI